MPSVGSSAVPVASIVGPSDGVCEDSQGFCRYRHASGFVVGPCVDKVALCDSFK